MQDKQHILSAIMRYNLQHMPFGSAGAVVAKSKPDNDNSNSAGLHVQHVTCCSASHGQPSHTVAAENRKRRSAQLHNAVARAAVALQPALQPPNPQQLAVGDSWRYVQGTCVQYAINP